MSEYIIELDSKHSIALMLALAEEARGGDAIRGEVVRCRDCKYANEDGDECVYFAAWEPLPEGDEFRDVYVDVEPNGFCAWGIKK